MTAKPTVACIVQARLTSARLPGKVMLPLPTGRSVVKEVMHRCLKICGVDKFVLAIPDTPENDILAEHVFDQPEFELYRGPESNVLERYIDAAEMVKADIVMRITADCPCLDPDVCSQVLDGYKGPEDSIDYVSNIEPMRSFPHGFDCEVFSSYMLYQSLVQEEYDAGTVVEHVTTWMRQSPYVQRKCMINTSDQSHIRLALDTLDDYIRIWKYLDHQADRYREVA